MYDNDACGSGHRGRRRARLRRAGLAAAVLALIGLLATACGGGSSPASASGGGGGGGSPPMQAQLAYAKCMRAHGVPDFPDPDSNGGFQGVPAGSQVTAADHVCHHLLNAGAPHLSPAQQQHMLGQMVKYARCMRAHGLPNFADPHTDNGGYIMGGDIDRNSPQYIAANQACQHLLPKGSSS
jgi:hypothetical protein